MATAALLFFSKTTLWTESLNVLHTPIFSVVLQSTLACSLSIDPTRIVKLLLLQGTERGEKHKTQPRRQADDWSLFPSPSLQTKPSRIAPQKPKSGSVLSNQKSPQKSSCQAVNICPSYTPQRSSWRAEWESWIPSIPSSVTGSQLQGSWRRNGFKLETED